MSLRKESDKKIEMEKKESSFKKESYNKGQGESDSSNVGGFKQKTKSNVSKSFNKYKDELENDDYGIESTNKISEQTFKATKSTKNQIKDFRESRNNNKLKKADDEHLKSVVEKLGNEQKNKQQKVSSKLNKDKKSSFDVKGSKDNKAGFLKKVINQPKKIGSSAKGKGIEAYKQNLESDDDGVKTGSEGLKLVKDSTKSVTQANRVRRKKGSVKKLKGHNTKLSTESKLRKVGLNSNLKKSQKALQKKKIMRNSIYKSKGKSPITLPSLTKSIGLNIKSGVGAIKKGVAILFKKVMATKVMAVAGALFVKLLPVFAVLGIAFGIIMMVMAMGGGGGGEEEIEKNKTVGFQTIDPAVEQWRDLVTEIADEKGMSDYVDLILAIIQIESGGDKYRDIMQSSESAGFPRNHYDNERDSVEQGVTHLKNVIETLKGYSSDYLNDTKLIAQTYNFGLGFAGHVGANNYEGYSLEIAENYSKSVVAVSLGNTTGETYPYNNSLSEKLGKTYLYRNGGNFLYGELVAQYTGFGDGNFFPPVEPILVTSSFGYRTSESTGGVGTTNHKGIDLNCDGGITPIKAVLDGQVVKSKYVGGLGNAVVIQHENGLYTTYGHMSSLIAENGQSVKAGETLGICGSTGNSSGPHLHLEVSPVPHQDQVDPYPYLQHLIGG